MYKPRCSVGQLGLHCYRRVFHARVLMGSTAEAVKI